MSIAFRAHSAAAAALPQLPRRRAAARSSAQEPCCHPWHSAMQVLHFHDTRIVNPDVRDELLQAISKLLQTKVRTDIA